MTTPGQNIIQRYFPPVPSVLGKRNSEDELIGPAKKKAKFSSVKEIALQELSIHHILIDKVCPATESLKSVVLRIVAIYNDAKKKKQPPYNRVQGLRAVEQGNFDFLAFTQVVPIKSRIFSYLKSLGGTGISTPQKINYVFFFYRSPTTSGISSSDLFALTTGDGWRVVRQFSNYSFPQAIARRLLNPEKISIVSERFLVGDTLLNERIARSFSANERPLEYFISNMRCGLRDGASIFALKQFQEKGTPIQNNLEIGAGIVRICKQLPMSSYPEILDHFAKIIHNEPTFSYSSEPDLKEEESIQPGFDFLDYFVPVDGRLASELNRALNEAVWSAFDNKENLYLDFRHKYSLAYSKASSFSLKYKEKKKLYEYEWHTVKSATEMLQMIRRIPPLAAASKEQFLKSLKKVKVSFVSSGLLEKASFVDYLEGLIRDKKGNPFWRLHKSWYCVSKDYLAHVQEKFDQLLDRSSLPHDFLPKKWPSPAEIKSQKAEAKDKKGTGRDPTEAKYNEQYLDIPSWILGDRICSEGIEMFDLFYYTDKNLYLVHVKQGFGVPTRDACSQIRNGAAYLNDALRRQGNTNKLELFYDLAVSSSSKGQDETYRKKAKEKLLKEFPEKADFIRKFTDFNGSITFVYAFADTSSGFRPLQNEGDLKASIGDLYKESAREILEKLQKEGFIDSEGSLTEISQSINQKNFIKRFSLRPQERNKKIHAILSEHRSLSKTSHSTVARLEILHTNKELAGLGFNFKICQIARTDYELNSSQIDETSVDLSENLDQEPFDTPFQPVEVASLHEASSSDEEIDSDTDEDGFLFEETLKSSNPSLYPSFSSQLTRSRSPNLEEGRFKLEGSSYIIKQTEGEGSCALHALLGEQTDQGFRFPTENYTSSSAAVKAYFVTELKKRLGAKDARIEESFVQVLSRYFNESINKNNADLSVQFLFLKTPGGQELNKRWETIKIDFEKKSAELKRKTVEFLLHLIKLEESPFLKKMMCKIKENIDKGISKDVDLFKGKNSEDILKILMQDPQLIYDVVMNDLNDFLSIDDEKKSIKEFSDRQTLILKERKTEEKKFILSDPVINHYTNTVNKKEFYLNTEDVELAAFLFNKKVQIVASRNNEVVPASSLINKDIEGEIIVIYHAGIHFSRCIKI